MGVGKIKQKGLQTRMNAKQGNSLLKYGRIMLFIPAVLYTLLTLFVIGIMLTSGGEDFMLTDFGGAWIMLTKQYPHVAEDFSTP